MLQQFGSTISGDEDCSPAWDWRILTEGCTSNADKNNSFRIQGVGEGSGFGVCSTSYDIISILHDGDNSTTSPIRSLTISSIGDMGFADNRMYFDKSAIRLGLNTITPDQELDITSSSPVIRLNGGGGVWDIGEVSLDDDFAIKLVSGGANLGRVLTIDDSSSNVGIFADDPAQQLTVRSPDGASAQIQVENTTSTVAERVLFRLTNKGKNRFRIDNGASTWTFDNSGSTFDISKVGTGVAELSVNQNGNMTIQGTLTQLSSRTAKQDIELLSTQQMLDKVLALQISEWSYKKDAGTRHIGPMAEDFYQAFGLGASNKGITSIDTGGVALAAIQGLKAQKDTEIAVLKAENKNLEKRLAELEKRFFASQSTARR